MAWKAGTGMRYKYKLIYVEWEDHHSFAGWSNETNVKTEPLICSSIGWLVDENKMGITLAGSYSVEEYGSTTYLLKKCIVKRVVIK
jgi:hypothetical protein